MSRPESEIVAIDLFCGAGGLSRGLEDAGITVLCGIDSWDVATRTYALNFSHPVLCADLSNMTALEIRKRTGIGNKRPDLVVGGPPCQGFSVQRVGPDYDVRNNLVLEFGRLVREFRPRMFLMENVPGLLGKRGRELALVFESEMAKAGYRCRSVLVNAAEYGVPQIRKRVIIFGGPEGESSAFEFPSPGFTAENFRTVHDVIADLPSPPEDHVPLPGDPLHRRIRLSPLNLKRIGMIPPGGGMENLPQEMRVDCHKNGAARIGHRFVYGRLAGDRPAATITARFDSFTRGKFGHPTEHRNITLREGARLQTFPDSFVFRGTQEEIAALVGNAVPPLLAREIGHAVCRALSEPSRSEAPSIPNRRKLDRDDSRQLPLFD